MQTCGSCKESLPYASFSPSYRGRNGTWCRGCFAAYKRGERIPGAIPSRMCVVCGVWYSPAQLKASVYCSRSCKDDAKNRRTREALEQSKPDRACTWCGEALLKTKRADAKFCSVQCMDRAHSVTRRAAQRAGLRNRAGELISLAAIGDRDRWRCGLCGGRVARDRSHPDPLAPSLDHIVPLSLGGSPDSPANLQLTHLRCNLAKRDRPAGEQLRLIG